MENQIFILWCIWKWSFLSLDLWSNGTLFLEFFWQRSFTFFILWDIIVFVCTQYLFDSLLKTNKHSYTLLSYQYIIYPWFYVLLSSYYLALDYFQFNNPIPQWYICPKDFGYTVIGEHDFNFVKILAIFISIIELNDTNIDFFKMYKLSYKCIIGN